MDWNVYSMSVMGEGEILSCVFVYHLFPVDPLSDIPDMLLLPNYTHTHDQHLIPNNLWNIN